MAFLYAKLGRVALVRPLAIVNTVITYWLSLVAQTLLVTIGTPALAPLVAVYFSFTTFFDGSHDY